jgi:hypothetical protein
MYLPAVSKTRYEARASADQAEAAASTYLLFCWNVLWKSAVVSIAIVALTYVYLSLQDAWGIGIALAILLLVVVGLRDAWFEIEDPRGSNKLLNYGTAVLIFLAVFICVAYACVYWLHYFGALPGSR